MPVTTRSAEALSANTDALALVFLRLPPKEQVLTVGALSTGWKQWAVQRLGTFWAGLSAKQRALAAVRAAKQGNTAALEWARTSPGGAAWGWGHIDAAGGSIQALDWLRDQGLPSDWYSSGYGWSRAYIAAAGCGHLETLKWLRAQQPWDAGACTAAARSGQLETLKWMRAQQPPCPWGAGACAAAACSGHLETLKWLRAQQPPCPWDEWVCALAAGGGHLETLMWLRAQQPPSPWDEQACTAAARSGHLEALKWLRAQQPPCPLNLVSCLLVASGQDEVVEWIEQQMLGTGRLIVGCALCAVCLCRGARALGAYI